MLMAGIASASAVDAQEAVTLTESFDYPNGTEAGNSSIPWEVKLSHKRMTGVKSGKLILNQAGQRVILFSPVHTGPAEVSIAIDAEAKNKKHPQSSRFQLMVSIDGQDWQTLRSIQGPFNEVVTAGFTTSQNFQLRILSDGWSYTQTLTLDDLNISINAVDSSAISLAEPVWVENFEGLQYKAKEDTGDTAWREYSDKHSYSGIAKDRFRLSARRSAAVWETEEIDISDFASTSVNAQISYKKHVNSSLEASVDGGEWISIWSEKQSNIRQKEYPTLVGNVSGDTLKLRFVADKWSTIAIHSVEVRGVDGSTTTTPEPVTGGLAQFAAIEDQGGLWYLDASTSEAASYSWFVDDSPVSTEAAFEIELTSSPINIRLETRDEAGATQSVSHALNLGAVQEPKLVTDEESSVLSWPTQYLSFSQIEIADANGNFFPVGDPIAGTGFSAHFVSSRSQEIRIAETLIFGGFDYSGENLDHLDMGATSAPNANFAAVQGRLVYLDHSDLSKSNWEGANLSFSELHDSDLGSARLVNSTFIDCVFDRANLSGADLSGADFENSDFREANLSNANLVNANLTNTDLRGANLDGANLSGAILVGALRD